MTTLNLLLILAISAMTTAGFLGLGSWGMLRMAKPSGQGGKDPEAATRGGVEPLYPDLPAEAGGTPNIPYRTVETDAMAAFNRAFGDAKAITFENFQDTQKRNEFENTLDKGQLKELEQKFDDPTVGLIVNKPDREKIMNFLRPRSSDGRFPATIGKDTPVSFCWVTGGSNDGFWLSADEVDKPADKVVLVDDFELPCKLPTAAQWLAACGKDGFFRLDKQPFGKGEYLADGKVIGPSDDTELAKDKKWMEPADASQRIKATTRIPAVAPPAIAEVDALTRRMAKEAGERANDAQAASRYLDKAREQLMAGARAAAAQNAEKETFAYRLVIEPAGP